MRTRLTIATLSLVLALLFAACAPRNDTGKSRYRLKIAQPLIASMEHSGEITIVPNYARNPDEAAPSVMFIDRNGNYHGLESTAVDSGYSVSPAVTLSGEGYLRITDGDLEEYLVVDVISSKASSIRYETRFKVPYDGSLIITAAVQDKFGNNLLPGSHELTITPSKGTLSSVHTDSSGVVLATLKTPSPGKVTLAISDGGSGLNAKSEVLFPEIALIGPDVHIIREDAPNIFPVDIYVRLEPKEKLEAYSVTLKLNELTAFHHLDTTETRSGIPLPEVIPQGTTVTLAGRPYPMLFYPSEEPIHIGIVWFECLGDGESVVMVDDAEYSVVASPQHRRPGNPAHWQRRGCVNKRRAKKLCINPIVLGASWTSAEMITELQHVQDNFDQACCAITIEINGVSLERINPQNLNPKRINGVTSNEGHLDDPGPVLDNHENLSAETERFIRQHAAQREANCLNVYFTRGLGGFMARRIDQWGNVLKQWFVPGVSVGTAITGKRLGQDGETVEDIPIRDSQGRPIGNGSPLSFDDVRSVFVHRGGIGDLTVKHEIGHALGLRHPDDYSNQAPIKRGGNRVMGQRPNRGRAFTAIECQKIMTDMSGLLRD